jgi:hypothetical protein
VWVQIEGTLALLPIKRRRLLLNYWASGNIADATRRAGYKVKNVKSACEMFRAPPLRRPVALAWPAGRTLPSGTGADGRAGGGGGPCKVASTSYVLAAALLPYAPMLRGRARQQAE